MVEGLRDHPLRASLNAEVHSRPFARLQSPERISHLALLSGEGAAERERRHVAALCESRGVGGPPASASHFYCDLRSFRLKWERHTEFSTYTFFVSGPFAAERSEAHTSALQSLMNISYAVFFLHKKTKQ